MPAEIEGDAREAEGSMPVIVVSTLRGWVVGRTASMSAEIAMRGGLEAWGGVPRAPMPVAMTGPMPAVVS